MVLRQWMRDDERQTLCVFCEIFWQQKIHTTVVTMIYYNETVFVVLIRNLFGVLYFNSSCYKSATHKTHLFTQYFSHEIVSYRIHTIYLCGVMLYTKAITHLHTTL